jgi:transcriptional regulator with XRE-family HTH domain
MVVESTSVQLLEGRRALLTTEDNTTRKAGTPGAVLRQLREAAGYSLAGLAGRAHMDRTLINKLESDRREMRPHHAEALDAALGSGGALQSLVRHAEDGDSALERRAVMWMFGAAASVTAAAGRATVEELIRGGLLDAIEHPDDWDTVLAETQRRLVLAPDDNFGATVAGKLVVLRQAINDKQRADDIRAAAMLSLFYGLWQGNQGRFGPALDWYQTAAALARRSGDPATETYVLGRSASRAVYEGMRRDRVQEMAERALAVTDKATLGALEARSALAGVAAMTGDIRGGRDQVEAMRRVADQLGEDDPVGPYPRSVNFDIFVEARGGDLASASRVRDEAEQALARTPLWLAESRIYYALAMARAGDVRGAAAHALDAIKTVPWAVHTLAMAASDVLTAVPRDDCTDEVMELRTYASTTPGPWETL